jgi:hypothetical protein
VGHSSRSTRLPPAEPPVCLEPTYAARRVRTAQLVKQSVDLLLAERARVSLSSVAARSHMPDVDPSGRGISESAILNNADARACYESHRSWKTGRRSPATRHSSQDDAGGPSTPRIGGDRDIGRAVRRYRRWHRSELAQRLVHVEQAYASQERYVAQLASNLFTWMLIVDRLLQSNSLQSSHTEATL